MSTFPNFDIQLEPGERLAALVGAHSHGGHWLRIDIVPWSGGGIRVFIPGDGRAERIANAINEAWPDPAPEASRVITHPRPSYHRQAEGLRAEDILPLATLDALNGDDPEETA